MFPILAALDVDVTVAVPPGARSDRRAIAGAVGAATVHHHLIDVDPTPAFDALGKDPRAARPEDLAAGAAGVLASRLAVANRRWRAGTS